MHLAVLYFSGREYGYGHAYRCQALIDAARVANYNVTKISNDPFLIGYCISALDTTGIVALQDILTEVRPDWLVIDMPDIPEIVANLAHELGIKVCLLNGVGHVLETLADLVWIQDTPERVILRPEFVTELPTRDWLVFGGGADESGLLPAFSSAMQHASAYLINTKLTGYSSGIIKSNKHGLVLTEGLEMLRYIRATRKAIIHMGMTAWELAALGKPVYVFSRTAEHLHFAQQMQQQNLVLAYSQVGLPEIDLDFRNFLATEFMPSGRTPDGLGAQRLLEVLGDKI